MPVSVARFRCLLLEQLRRPVEDPSVRTEVTPTFIRLVGAGFSESENSVLWIFATEPEAMRKEVLAQKQFFSSQGKSFEWKYCSFFSPVSLKTVLVDEGATPQESEEWLLWHPGLPLPSSSCALEISELRIPEEMAAVIALQSQVWNRDFHWLTESLLREKSAAPDRLRFFGAKDPTGQLVAVGWLRLQGKVATLHGGSTLPAFRKQGAFTALVRKRLQLATERGAEVVCVDASPRSLPILSQLGFLSLGETIPFNFPAE